MKICVINDRFMLKGPSGGVYRILGIAKQLQRFGFDVRICCPQFSSKSLYEFPEFSLPKSWIQNQYMNSIKLLQRVIENEDCDIFLIELPCPVTKGITVLYGKLKGKQVFIDFGDVWFSDETGTIHKTINTQFVKNICKKADKISAATKTLQEVLTKLTSKEVLYVPCGVDLDLFNPNRIKEINISEVKGKFTILYQGTVSTFTGCHYLPQLAKDVINKKNDVVFLIIGSGPYLKELKSEIKEENLSKYFHFVGEIPHQLIPSYIALANLCIAQFPARRDISVGVFPIKIVEYMAMGKPVVSTNIAEVKNIIMNGYDGFYCSIEEMGSLLTNLVENPEGLKKIGIRARETVVAKYSWEKIVSSLIKLNGL